MAKHMELLIWIGTGLTLFGLAGLGWCIRKATRLRGADLDEDEMRAEVQSMMFGHMAAIGVAFLGLGLVVSGMLLS